MGYSLIEGRFYYGNTDEDYLDFKGFVRDSYGGGAFIAGETIKPGNAKKWKVTYSSSKNASVVIEKAENFGGSIYDHPSYDYDDLFVTNYFDSSSGRNIAPVKEKYGGDASNFNDFSGELFVDGMVYEFDSETSVDLPKTGTQSTPTPTPTPTPSPVQTPTTSTPVIPNNQSTINQTKPSIVEAIGKDKLITVTFDRELAAEYSPNMRLWTIRNDDRIIGIKYINIDNVFGEVSITLEENLDAGTQVNLSYRDLAGDQSGGIIESKYGVDLASVNRLKVDNQTRSGSSAITTTPSPSKPSTNNSTINTNELTKAQGPKSTIVDYDEIIDPTPKPTPTPELITSGVEVPVSKSWANKLWDWSDKDGIINVHIDKRGSYDFWSRRIFRKHANFVKNFLSEVESATGLEIKITNRKNSDIWIHCSHKPSNTWYANGYFVVDLGEIIKGDLNDQKKKTIASSILECFGLDDIQKGIKHRGDDSLMSNKISQSGYTGLTIADINALQSLW